LQEICRNGQLAPLLAGTALAWLAGCGDAPEPAARPALLPPPPASSDCGDRAYLRTNFYGEFSGPVDWVAPHLECEGMPRPDGAGARLRFAGQAGDMSLAIIIAMPDFERGMEARELGSNVTVIEEGGGRFFSTSGIDSCWTDVFQQQETGEDVNFVAGRLYCIAPLAEVNGDSSVTLRELEFGGYVDWTAK
jgi:hypothetical protein